MALLISPLRMAPRGSPKRGRRNIRRIKEDISDELTIQTVKNEDARKRRLQERRTMLERYFDNQNAAVNTEKKLILDLDVKTNEELVIVDPKLVKKLKSHQVEGIRFMWDACFESLEELATGKKGGGCILAHNMGLGKTLQVIALVHTLFRHRETNVKTVLILSPKSTILNWKAEFGKWLIDLNGSEEIDVSVFTTKVKRAERADYLGHWAKNGGVMIMGYDMFSNLLKNDENVKEEYGKQIISALQNPGPDVVVCDEGHIFKNPETAIWKAMMGVRTARRILLTGTPLQNNLMEYYSMVEIVKPHLLGSPKEFRNRFVNPIRNGTFSDSTRKDFELMRKKTRLLHQMLVGTVQRFDESVLKQLMPPKHEFVIFVGLSDLQARLYEHYVKRKFETSNYIKKTRKEDGLLVIYSTLRPIWTHPLALKMKPDAREKDISNKSINDSMATTLEEDGKEKGGGIRRSDENELGIDFEKINISTPEDKHGKKENDQVENSGKNELDDIDFEKINITSSKEWWHEFVTDDDFEDLEKGPKVMLLFAILNQCQRIGDKILIFSQSTANLDMIEYFLKKISSSPSVESNEYIGLWEKGLDYFRLDGNTPDEKREEYCERFNRSDNKRTRLFLLSTKAGGLGINLTAANRVIIFDVSWNPSDDTQSIFRVHRIGQTKPCYIYRFVSQGTMEEKIYERQVTKQSVSLRVVDKQQTDRHYTEKEITELYTFNRKAPVMEVALKLPADSLLEEVLKQCRSVIIDYHEHNSLLKNVQEEEECEDTSKHYEAFNRIEISSKQQRCGQSQSMDSKDVIAETLDKIKREWMLTAIEHLLPESCKNPEFEEEEFLVHVRKKLFHYYSNEGRRNCVNKLLPSNMSSSVADIATPVLLDVIHAVEAAIPIYLRTLKRDLKREENRTKLRVREEVILKEVNTIERASVEEIIKNLFPEDWKNQRFELKEILRRVRKQLTDYYMSETGKNHLNKLIVAHVFDEKDPNQAAENRKQALINVVRNVCHTYLETRTSELRSQFEDGKSGNDKREYNIYRYQLGRQLPPPYPNHNEICYNNNQQRSWRPSSTHQNPEHQLQLFDGLCYYHHKFGDKAYFCGGKGCRYRKPGKFNGTHNKPL